MMTFKTTVILFAILIGGLNCSRNSTNTKIKLNADLTPSQIVRIYWEASLLGEEEIVQNLTTIIPNSFYNNCSAMQNVNTPKSDSNGIRTDDTSIPIEAKGKVSEKFTEADGKFGRFYNPDSQSFSIYAVARMIYMERILYNDIFIENISTFEDQARIDIKPKHPIYASDTGETFFLEKTEEGWRIFTIKHEATFFLVGNKNYGKSKPDCNNKP